jgi:hypothetical protein
VNNADDALLFSWSKGPLVAAVQVLAVAHAKLVADVGGKYEGTTYSCNRETTRRLAWAAARLRWCPDAADVGVAAVYGEEYP